MAKSSGYKKRSLRGTSVFQGGRRIVIPDGVGVELELPTVGITGTTSLPSPLQLSSASAAEISCLVSSSKSVMFSSSL